MDLMYLSAHRTWDDQRGTGLSEGVGRLRDVEPFGAVRFTALARLLAQEARRHGLVAPGFRSPPRLPGAQRSIRRYPDGAAVVAVSLRGREHDEVIDDMVEGIVVANELTGTAATGWRLALHGIAQAALDRAALEQADPHEDADEAAAA